MDRGEKNEPGQQWKYDRQRGFGIPPAPHPRGIDLTKLSFFNTKKYFFISVISFFKKD
jgi:hypothetical protein